MKRIVIAALLLTGCAANQSVQLLPRGTAEQGSGELDRIKNVLTVDLGGKRYQGTMQMQSENSLSWGLLGPRTTGTTTRQASALLVGDGGQIRCEWGFDALLTSATGVCIDSKNATYDLLIKQ